MELCRLPILACLVGWQRLVVICRDRYVSRLCITHYFLLESGKLFEEIIVLDVIA
jgi:hypothetical protein